MKYHTIPVYAGGATGDLSPVLDKSLAEFAEDTLTKTVTCSIFNGKRRLTDFQEQNFLFFDFDGHVLDDGTVTSHSLKEVHDSFALLDCPFVITTSKSHKKIKNISKTTSGKPIDAVELNCHRCHVHVPLASPILHSKYTRDILGYYVNGIGLDGLDQNTRDATRIFNPGKNYRIYNSDKPLLFIPGTLLRDIQANLDFHVLQHEREKGEAIENEELVEEVMEIIMTSLRPAVTHQSRHQSTISAGHRIFEMGGNYNHFQEYNQTKCTPPWKAKDLENKWDYICGKGSRREEKYLRGILKNHNQ